MMLAVELSAVVVWSVLPALKTDCRSDSAIAALKVVGAAEENDISLLLLELENVKLLLELLSMELKF